MKQKTPTMRPTKADFDAAVTRCWSQSTCLLAACAKRHGFESVYNAAGNLIPELQLYGALMFNFDGLFRVPGDEKSPALQKMRANLPDSE